MTMERFLMFLAAVVVFVIVVFILLRILDSA